MVYLFTVALSMGLTVYHANELKKEAESRGYVLRKNITLKKFLEIFAFFLLTFCPCLNLLAPAVMAVVDMKKEYDKIIDKMIAEGTLVRAEEAGLDTLKRAVKTKGKQEEKTNKLGIKNIKSFRGNSATAYIETANSRNQELNGALDEIAKAQKAQEEQNRKDLEKLKSDMMNNVPTIQVQESSSNHHSNR